MSPRPSSKVQADGRGSKPRARRIEAESRAVEEAIGVLPFAAVRDRIANCDLPLSCGYRRGPIERAFRDARAAIAMGRPTSSQGNTSQAPGRSAARAAL